MGSTASGLPVTDTDGQRLVSLVRTGEDRVDDGLACPLALVVVRRPDGAILLGRNRWRDVWELPGGQRDDGEPVRAAAVRELHEETGLSLGLAWAGAAGFELTRPDRRERAAVFVADLSAPTEARPVDGELVDFVWVDPQADPPADTSPLDWAVARWALTPVAGMAATLTTERLTLDALSSVDFHDVHALFSTPGRLIGDGVSSEDQTRRWLARRELRRRETGLCWYRLRWRDDPARRLLGDVGLFLGRTGDEPEIGLEIAEAYRGRGVATEATHAAVAAAHEIVPRVWATVRPWNAPSLAVLDRAGFVRDHTEDDERGAVIYLHHSV